MRPRSLKCFFDWSQIAGKKYEIQLLHFLCSAGMLSKTQNENSRPSMSDFPRASGEAPLNPKVK